MYASASPLNNFCDNAIIKLVETAHLVINIVVFEVYNNDAGSLLLIHTLTSRNVLLEGRLKKLTSLLI